MHAASRGIEGGPMMPPMKKQADLVLPEATARRIMMVAGGGL
jgi:hypothetical protein